MSQTCLTCQTTKALLSCGLCQESVCKNCAQFLGEDSFSFLPKIPSHLSHSTYCVPCFDTQVAPELENYNEMMKRAKNVNVFFKGQGKETRLMKRKEKPFVVENCLEKNEVMMRLAFLAAHANFSALIDVDIISEKVINGRYQTTKWRGTGIPFQYEERSRS